jgi:toxin YoeB
LAKTFTGVGKPKPLLFNLSGCWSRRIDDQRTVSFVYEVTDEELIVASCYPHY